MKRYLMASGLFVGATAGALFVLLIPEVILDLYLSGHGYTWHEVVLVGDLDALGMLWAGGAFLTGVIVGGGYLWATRSPEDNKKNTLE